MYQVVKCGASGHNIRCRASMRATPIGMMVLGNQVQVVTEVSKDHFIKSSRMMLFMIFTDL